MTNFKCNLCGCEFRTGSHLVNHMRIHTGERPFKCAVDECEMAFKQKIALEDHVKFKHSNERPFKWDYPRCDYAAKTSANLLVHKKKHSIERPFACPQNGCSYRTKWKNYIKSHENRVHRESKAFACTMCHYKTTEGVTLKHHMLRHSNRRDFKCNHPQCRESYKSSAALKYHFTNQHGEKNIQCDQPGCRRKFANTQAFRIHKRNVHVEKSHACPNLNCNYRTKLAGNLARHMIVHEGKNERISCSIEGCEYKGKNSRAVKSHMRLHEKTRLLKCSISGCRQYAWSKEVFNKTFHNPLGRPFQCPLCFKRYSKRFQLDSHLLVHTKEKPFRCGHCNYAASCRANVRTHMSSVHSNLQFPFITVLPLNDRECIRCKVTLPLGEFILHLMGHTVPIVMVQRLEIK